MSESLDHLEEMALNGLQYNIFYIILSIVGHSVLLSYYLYPMQCSMSICSSFLWHTIICLIFVGQHCCFSEDIGEDFHRVQVMVADR